LHHRGVRRTLRARLEARRQGAERGREGPGWIRRRRRGKWQDSRVELGRFERVELRDGPGGETDRRDRRTRRYRLRREAKSAVDPVAAGESNGDLAVAVASTQHTPHCRRGGGPFPRGVILAISAEPHTRSEVLRVDVGGSARQEIRIVLADDHAVVRAGLRALLEKQPGFVVVGEAETGGEA